MPLALLALAIGAFGIGTTEFVIMGLLPQVAADYAVSIPTAGYLVTGYALGVVVGAPLMTVLGTRVSRKRMLMLLMGLFVVGNALSALAPVFGVMLAGRLVASLAHGSFFGIGSVVAADLVAPQKRAGAIAMMFTGLTVANVVGVPLGTLVGQAIGWRVTFLLIAVLGVVGLLGVAWLVPEQPRAEGVRVRHELAALRNVQVLLAMAMTVLGFGGVFAAITYIAPMMTDVAGFADTSVTWLLVLFGLGMVGGNLVGGRFADRALMPMLYVSLGGLAVVLALFTLTAHNKIASAVTIALIGALGFATVPPLQKRVLDQAAGAPTLASALNIGAFNLGNALSAWLGGIVIAAGFGYTAPNWVGAVLAGSALVLAVVSAVLERNAARGSGADGTGEQERVNV
ncbi:MFS transporter, DHA1 family, arabinose polymer transporter [Streptoalloteichus tenebrarius]|uniref:MFS transporter, DHA1 family, arabinose polymer transporter n=1 Tax=Streptoalloteichus tenebrarius (strain ATCC 17920 / DSM 40477 / JCM 4838 / CBS 697.72 / NBRC 16177 / NCIMB 11028 / NRRL B-12390 / A12253. 1 / ISP 5477) TaxID=1933 RepID=A0ABT1HNV4_STRSD|nr:MFS transporter [Streptoalloteichus tenebrarius]MCP2257193.1 MFS transporter, DHA1 family, arabinose polymer transporter [Streptoalloteichus tenebrarius]BFE98826.1 MFS transporter [Streptoalloteichus tenebrarius]